MKKFGILILFFIPISGYGQILDNTNRWNDLEVLIPTCKSNNCEGKYYITHSYSLTSDSIINNKTYKAIIDTFYQQQSPSQTYYTQPAGFIRQMDKKVFYISNYSNNEEFLLYDFGLTLGEYFNWQALTFIVSSIDSIEYEGKKHLTLSLENQSQTIVWIEDIGAKQGFLYANYYFFESKLLCFESHNIQEYINDSGLDCLVTINSVNEINNSFLKIYPNPTDGLITFQSGTEITKITILDLFGKTIYQFEPNRLNYSISISNLEKGIYLLKVNNQIRKIVKN